MQIQPTNKIQRLPRPTKAATPSQRPLRPTRVVNVQSSDLYDLWINHANPGECRNASEDSKLAMKKVDDAMKNLRKARTLNSLERASLDVSVALIDLAAYDDCENPFVCLHQAAMFAGLGSKRGNNDEAFKRFLPLKVQCSPLEALNILGRADCLGAIHFLQEAQYLCTWVASVCHIHRGQQEGDLPWSNKWRVVGIMTYIVSSTIEETAGAVYQAHPGAEILKTWDEDAQLEIDCGKSDALVLVDTNSSQARCADEPTPGDEWAIDSDLNGHGQQSEDLDNSTEYPYYSEEVSEEYDAENVDEGEDYYDPYAGVEVVGI